jgi:hypothetical protein
VLAFILILLSSTGLGRTGQGRTGEAETMSDHTHEDSDESVAWDESRARTDLRRLARFQSPEQWLREADEIEAEASAACAENSPNRARTCSSWGETKNVNNILNVNQARAGDTLRKVLLSASGPNGKAFSSRKRHRREGRTRGHGKGSTRGNGEGMLVQVLPLGTVGTSKPQSQLSVEALTKAKATPNVSRKPNTLTETPLPLDGAADFHDLLHHILHTPRSPDLATAAAVSIIHSPLLDRQLATHSNHVQAVATPTPTTTATTDSPFGDLCLTAQDLLDLDVLVQQAMTTTTLQQQKQQEQQQDSWDFTNIDFAALESLALQHQQTADAGYLQFSRYKVLRVETDNTARPLTKTLHVAYWKNDHDRYDRRDLWKNNDINDRSTHHHTRATITAAKEQGCVQRKTEQLCTVPLPAEDGGLIQLRDEWYCTNVSAGDIIHICSLTGASPTETLPISLDSNMNQNVDNICAGSDLVLIVHPDLLLTPTTISEAVACTRRAILKNRLGSTGWTGKSVCMDVCFVLRPLCLGQPNPPHNYFLTRCLFRCSFHYFLRTFSQSSVVWNHAPRSIWRNHEATRGLLQR